MPGIRPEKLPFYGVRADLKYISLPHPLRKGLRKKLHTHPASKSFSAIRLLFLSISMNVILLLLSALLRLFFMTTCKEYEYGQYNHPLL